MTAELYDILLDAERALYEGLDNADYEAVLSLSLSSPLRIVAESEDAEDAMDDLYTSYGQGSSWVHWGVRCEFLAIWNPVTGAYCSAGLMLTYVIDMVVDDLDEGGGSSDDDDDKNEEPIEQSEDHFPGGSPPE